MDTERERVAERYRLLVEQLGRERGFKRGWVKAVAGQLGTHPNTITKVHKGDRKMGWEAAYRAVATLGLNPWWFTMEDTPEDYTQFLTGQEFTEDLARVGTQIAADQAKYKPRSLQEVQEWAHDMLRRIADGPPLSEDEAERFMAAVTSIDFVERARKGLEDERSKWPSKAGEVAIFVVGSERRRDDD